MNLRIHRSLNTYEFAIARGPRSAARSQRSDPAQRPSGGESSVPAGAAVGRPLFPDAPEWQIRTWLADFIRDPQTIQALLTLAIELGGVGRHDVIRREELIELLAREIWAGRLLVTETPSLARVFTQEPLPAPAPTPQPATAQTPTHWIEIALVDEFDQPVSGERFELTLPDQEIRRGRLDPRGKAKLEDLEVAGAAMLTFPDLDLDAWEPWTPASVDELQPGPVEGDPVNVEDNAPVGGGGGGAGAQLHVVRSGDCIDSIAFKHGLHWKTVWEHGLNAQLRERRGNPNVLLPGDDVYVPARRRRDEPVTIDQTNKFRRRGVPSRFRVTYEDARGNRFVNEPYGIEFDTMPARAGVTNADGLLDEPIPPDTRRIRVQFRRRQARYEYELGEMEPIGTIRGVQQRLQNIGYAIADVSGRVDSDTQLCLRAFQVRYGLPETGEPDDETRRRLLEEHGA